MAEKREWLFQKSLLSVGEGPDERIEVTLDRNGKFVAFTGDNGAIHMVGDDLESLDSHTVKEVLDLAEGADSLEELYELLNKSDI